MTKDCGHFARNERGVTLIELIAVIIVLGILAAIAVPRFGNLDAFKARGFYDQLTSALRYAQKVAVASGCAVQVSVSSTQLTLNQYAGCSSGSPNVPVPIPGQSSSSNTLSAPSDTTLSASPTIFVFDSRGRAVDPTTGDPLTNYVTVQVGSRSLKVYGDTGYVDAP